MKKMIVMAMAALVCGCEKPVFNENAVAEIETAHDLPTKQFTFIVKGDFGSATFTRGYLEADGHAMTDLWVFDYMDGVCIQQSHQTATDEGWGKPTLALAYGSHHVYFVASRGEGATLDKDGHTIVWTGPRDTFWKEYAVDVVSSSNGNRAVTLDRVATKLRLAVNDEVPEGCKSVAVTPERWYYGWDYVNGLATAAQQSVRIVDVPESLIGTIGQLAVNIYGLSSSDEWVTNIDVKAEDAGGSVIGSARIVGAPFKANRSTDYNGNLFGSNGGLDVNINAAWDTTIQGSW